MGQEVLVDLVPAARGVEERGDVELERDGRRQVPLGRDGRVKLAEPARLDASEGDRGGAGRVKEGLRCGRELGLGADARERAPRSRP